MSEQSSRRPTTRTALTRARVLGAALRLADEQGIDVLSMRRLARELGVEAMSLYYHVANKEALLEGMLDAVFGEMALPAQTEEWRPAIRACAISAHHTLLRHPWACGLLMSPARPSRSRLHWMDAVLGTFRQAGFSAELTHHAYHALDSHIVGFTLWVLPYLAIQREQPNFAQQFLERTSLDGLPYLAEHIDYHLADRPGETSEFDFGLDLLLDGLEELRRQPASEGAAAQGEP